MKRLLSIVVPAFNEEILIEQFLADVKRYADKLKIGYEILVVENGSSDSTAEKISQFKKNNQNIKLLQLPEPNYGQALIKGFIESQGEYILVFNVDFWDKSFMDLATVDLKGYDIIIGSKSMTGSEDQRTLNRKLITKGFNIFLNVFLGYKGTDTHGIKIMRTAVAKNVLKKCRTKSAIFDTELIIRAQIMNYKILELPVAVTELRSPRFKLKRLIETPVDIWNLYSSLKFK